VQKDRMTADRGQAPFAGWLNAGTWVVWVCVCYLNGKIGHSLRVWAERLSVSDRGVRIGELIGRYRTLEPFLPFSSAFDGDGICTFVTAMLHPHSLARTGG